jgi:hypothetical protein
MAHRYKFEPPLTEGKAQAILAKFRFVDSGWRIGRTANKESVKVWRKRGKKEFKDCVYAFVFGSLIVRFGTAEKLSTRVSGFAGYVTGYWNSASDESTREEGEGWKWLFNKYEGKNARVYVRRPKGRLPTGIKISTALSEEAYYIKKYQPCLNRSHR